MNRVREVMVLLSEPVTACSGPPSFQVLRAFGGRSLRATRLRHGAHERPRQISNRRAARGAACPGATMSARAKMYAKTAFLNVGPRRLVTPASRLSGRSAPAATHYAACWPYSKEVLGSIRTSHTAQESRYRHPPVRLRHRRVASAAAGLVESLSETRLQHRHPSCRVPASQRVRDRAGNGDDAREGGSPLRHQRLRRGAVKGVNANTYRLTRACSRRAGGEREASLGWRPL